MSNKTILFIHGAWMTSKCWEPFISYFQDKGYTCVAPDWPYDDRPIAELRANPAPELVNVGVPEIVDHYAAVISQMDEPPIIIGHSFGGLFTQMLLDRGLGSAGVALDPAPPKGVPPTPGLIKGNWEPLTTWQGWKKVLTLSPKGFANLFGNGFGEGSSAAYEKYVVPTPGRVFFQAGTALFHNALAVNYKNDSRAPLLLTAGGQDRIIPAGIIRATYKKYAKANARTDFIEFPERSHMLIMEPGWEEVAAYVLGWLEKLPETAVSTHA
jgi:pimeloyl-ACP methyl ester carboxylesterase